MFVCFSTTLSHFQNSGKQKYFLAACRFRRILRNALHLCIFFCHNFSIIFQSSLILLFLSLLGCMTFGAFLLLLYNTYMELSLVRLIQTWSRDDHTPNLAVWFSPPSSLGEMFVDFAFLFWPSLIAVFTSSVLLQLSALTVIILAILYL